VLFNDLHLVEELEDRDFRNQFFRTEREIDIPAQIKSLRKFRELNQAELAERVGTKQSAISRLERSQDANYELETLVKIAEALDARLSILIEPYELVIARYRQERASATASAASAKTEVPQRRAIGIVSDKEEADKAIMISRQPPLNQIVTGRKMDEGHGLGRD
jgi:transcriptional regulator with XRE-family HTH domain